MPALLLAGLAACTDGRAPAGRAEARGGPSPAAAEAARREYAVAVEQARAGLPEGYRRLLGLAQGARSPEWAELSKDQLLYLLYAEPERWVRAMAPLDGASLRAYLGAGGLTLSGPPWGTSTPGSFEADVVAALARLSGSPAEEALATFVAIRLRGSLDAANGRDAAPVRAREPPSPAR